MKVRHPRYYRPAGNAAATRSAPDSTNHASCGRATRAGQTHTSPTPAGQTGRRARDLTWSYGGLVPSSGNRGLM
jgi:hypothetical protein